MGYLSFIKELISKINGIDSSIKTGLRFSQKEMAEIISVCKKENLKYFERLSKMQNLRYFDISFLLSEVTLDDNKIEIIEKAQKLYNDEEFQANGQTQSDFIFRVAANLDYLSLENIEVFKELVKCKNEVYDFANILENPSRYLTIKNKNREFAFERVIVD